jgi:hypothetical protein
MSFVFRELTVSGSNQGVEGTSGVINAITDAMTTAGWAIEDDRRSQAGSTSLVTTHKIVLKSDGGELGTSPNWYLTLTSGTSSTQGLNDIGTQISTAYDVGAHDVSASGIKNPDTGTLSSLTKLVTDSDGYNALWIAADKDVVVIVNNYVGTSFSAFYAGKAVNFLDEDKEPYGVMTRIVANHAWAGSGAVGIVGNPPENITTGSDGYILYYAFAATNEPRVGLGNPEALFTAVPWLWVVNDASPLRKGAIGYLKHCYSGAPNTAGVPFIGKAVVSETGQEFRVFAGAAASFYLRAS